jgi:hypothetical protein
MWRKTCISVRFYGAFGSFLAISGHLSVFASHFTATGSMTPADAASDAADTQLGAMLAEALPAASHSDPTSTKG